jgi:hypothetical protein
MRIRGLHLKRFPLPIAIRAPRHIRAASILFRTAYAERTRKQ